MFVQDYPSGDMQQRNPNFCILESIMIWIAGIEDKAAEFSHLYESCQDDAKCTKELLDLLRPRPQRALNPRNRRGMQFLPTSCDASEGQDPAKNRQNILLRASCRACAITRMTYTYEFTISRLSSSRAAIAIVTCSVSALLL